MKQNLIRWLLVGIIVIAALLRFYSLGTVPASLNWDEIAWGYNGYSLSVDGRDEFGVFLPLQYIESFGDFKPPLYAYLTALSIKLFGLSEFATRFPSALFGTLTVLMSYFLVRKLFYNAQWQEQYALMTVLLLAISPWHIMLSRAAFEANLVTFFIVLGIWLFLKGIRDKGYFLILSVLPFAASFYTFNSARIVTPGIVLLLCLSFLTTLYTKKRKEIIIAGFLGVLLLAPLIPFLLSEQAALRYKEVNIFSDIQVIERSNQAVLNDENAWWSRLLHHRYALFSVEFTKHYLDHFNPDFLFIKGDVNPKFSTQSVGQLYLFELPFFIAGLIMLFRRKEGYWWVVPLWLLIGIIPAATARETPHALRIESTLPTFQIFSAIGIVWFLQLVKTQQRRLFIPAVAALSCIALVSVLYYVHGYYTHYVREYSSEWQYGYKDAIGYVRENESSYDQVYVSEALGRPYAYFLFYTQTDPRDFRSTAKVTRDTFGFVHVDRFANYVFPKRFTFTKGDKRKILYVGTRGDVPGHAKVLKEFTAPNGIPQLVAFTL